MVHLKVVSFEENVDRMIHDQLQEIDYSFCWVPGKRMLSVTSFTDWFASFRSYLFEHVDAHTQNAIQRVAVSLHAYLLETQSFLFFLHVSTKKISAFLHLIGDIATKKNSL